MALTHAAKEAMWIRQFLSDIFFGDTLPTVILGDNQGAMALAVNPAFHAHTKHIRVRHHFIRECVESGDIDLKYVPTADQVADALTKGLPVVKFKKFALEMGLVGVSAR